MRQFLFLVNFKRVKKFKIPFSESYNYYANIHDKNIYATSN